MFNIMNKLLMQSKIIGQKNSKWKSLQGIHKSSHKKKESKKGGKRQSRPGSRCEDSGEAALAAREDIQVSAGGDPAKEGEPEK